MVDSTIATNTRDAAVASSIASLRAELASTRAELNATRAELAAFRRATMPRLVELERDFDHLWRYLNDVDPVALWDRERELVRKINLPRLSAEECRERYFGKKKE